MSGDSTKTKSDKRRVPIDPSVLVIPSPPQEPFLVGTKCKACGAVFFPKVLVCMDCSHNQLEEISLGRRGKVYNSTVLRLAPPMYQGPVPFAQGHVELPEGVLVLTAFTRCGLDKPLAVGTEVEVVFERFGEDEEGNEVVTYKFAPI